MQNADEASPSPGEKNARMNHAELVEALKEHGVSEHQARHRVFEELFRSEYGRACGFVIKHGAERQEAEDAVQQAFLELYRHFDRVVSPQAWVRTVALRAWFRTCSQVDRNAQWIEAVRERWDQAVNSPEESTLGEMWVHQVVRTLPSRQREVVIARSAGLSTNETAKALNMSPATVRVHLHHARQVLANLTEQSP
ncbi:RNA polymerase sigma factor [Actinomadura kijaniata]|uniref:RNA polymerase sigma factor n=1 Tax=Actinomadura kijaniata TaxID=46161 RepID=UPI003F1CFDA8